MEPLTTVGESVLIVIAGLILRFLLALAVLAIIVVPILAVFKAMRIGGSLKERWQGVVHVGHLLLKKGLYYAPGHTWLREEGASTLRLGLDDLAQRLLTGIRAIRIAKPGRVVRRGETIAEVTLDGRTARIAAPVDGTILDVNGRVEEVPDLVHRDPYRRGWLAVLVPTSIGYHALPTGEAAHRWLEREDRRLASFFETELGVAAADGGEYVLPPPALLTEGQWNEVTRMFLEEPVTTA
jgi:glycine cleavage system H protein